MDENTALSLGQASPSPQGEKPQGKAMAQQEIQCPGCIPEGSPSPGAWVHGKPPSCPHEDPQGGTSAPLETRNKHRLYSQGCGGVFTLKTDEENRLRREGQLTSEPTSRE